MARDTIAKSIPESRTVRGYEIRRLPLGKYLEAIQAMKNAPNEIMQACFPGMSQGEILATLKFINGDTLSGMIMNAMFAIPDEVISLLSIFTGISKDTLLSDENIGADGAVEMLTAFWELNNMDDFFKRAVPGAAKIIKLLGIRLPNGFSA